MVAISGTAAGRPQEAAGEADRQAAPWHRPEPAYRRGRRPDIPAGLQAWPRRHRVETAERALPVGPVAGLAQGQEPVPHRGLFGAVEDPFADILGHGSRSPDRIHNTDGQPLAYIYSRESKVEARRTKRLTKDEARRIAVNVTRLPEPLGKAAGGPRDASAPWSLRTMGKRLRFRCTSCGMTQSRFQQRRSSLLRRYDCGLRTVRVALFARRIPAFSPFSTEIPAFYVLTGAYCGTARAQSGID
jgi:hypothetical protein